MNRSTGVGAEIPPQQIYPTVLVHILDTPFTIDAPYTYYVPKSITDEVVRGAFVTVPFGRGNRKQLGLVVEVLPPAAPEANTQAARFDVKPIIRADCAMFEPIIPAAPTITNFSSVKNFMIFNFKRFI